MKISDSIYAFINLIKEIRRFFLYHYEWRKHPKPLFKNDCHFPLAHNLRLLGYATLSASETFRNIPSAEKIVNAYRFLDMSPIEQVVKEVKYKSGRAYKKELAAFFDPNTLLEYANDAYIVENISQYFGFKPMIRHISVWLDCPTNDENSIETQIFHRDPEDIKLVKTYLYLKDVDELSGPFCYVEKSHLDPWHSFSKHYHNDKDIKRLYPNSNFISCTGTAGSFIMADVNGFHRGIKPKDDYRVLVTVYYSSATPRQGLRETVFDVNFSEISKRGPKVQDYSYL